MKLGTWSPESSDGPLGITIGWVRRLFDNLCFHSGVCGDRSILPCTLIGDVSRRFLLSTISFFHCGISGDVLGSFSLLDICTPLIVSGRFFRLSASSFFHCGTTTELTVFVGCGRSVKKKRQKMAKPKKNVKHSQEGTESLECQLTQLTPRER